MGNYSKREIRKLKSKKLDSTKTVIKTFENQPIDIFEDFSDSMPYRKLKSSLSDYELLGIVKKASTPITEKKEDLFIEKRVDLKDTINDKKISSKIDSSKKKKTILSFVNKSKSIMGPDSESLSLYRREFIDEKKQNTKIIPIKFESNIEEDVVQKKKSTFDILNKINSFLSKDIRAKKSKSVNIRLREEDVEPKIKENTPVGLFNGLEEIEPKVNFDIRKLNLADRELMGKPKAFNLEVTENEYKEDLNIFGNLKEVEPKHGEAEIKKKKMMYKL